MKIKYNFWGMPEPSRVYLCRPDNSLICELNGSRDDESSYEDKLNNMRTLSLTVNKCIDGEISNGYDQIDVGMYLLVERVGYFRMSVPQIENDGYTETKKITASSCDWELTTKSISLEVNCGTNTSLEYLDEDNLVEAADGLRLPKEYVSLYNKDNPKLSLLDVILEDIPTWSVGYIDPTLLFTKNDSGQNVLVKRSFSTDGTDVYSFLTQTVSQAYKCIFLFDILHRKINAYALENLGKDSGIWMSFRNLSQSISIQEQSQNSVYTRFRVAGGDSLGIESVNFGSNYIEDLSYFMREPYVTHEFADKYSQWKNLYEEKRKEYREATLKYNQALTDQTEVNMRVPNDGCKTDWSTFKNKELKNLIKVYVNSANLLKNMDYSGQYSAEEDTQLPDSISSDACFQDDVAQLSDKVNKWLDAWLKKAKVIYDSETSWSNASSRRDYYAYTQSMIPNIRIQLQNNYGKENTLYYEDIDALDDWETQWDLYGLTELKNKLKSYQENAQSLIKYAKDDPDADDNYQIFHRKWVDYDKLSKECEAAIEQRQKEYDSYTAVLDGLTKQRQDLMKSVDKSAYFTEKEIKLLSQFYNDTDYVNENIITIDNDTDEDRINVQEQLYQDAIEELGKESQPQLAFSVTSDNLLAVPEFKGLCDNFDVGNFLYLSVKGDDKYFVKQRITGITWNPCCIEGDLALEFSNMVKSKSERNDFTTLLDDSISSAKNQIKATVKSTIDSSAVTISDSILQALAHSSLFSKTVSDGVYQTITANKGVFNKVFADSVNANEVLANSGMFEHIQASDGTFVDTLAVSINASRISVGTLSVDRLIFRSRQAEDGTYQKSVMYELNSAGTLEGTEITDRDREYYELNGKVISANSIAAEKIVANSITAKQLAAEAITSFNGKTKLNLDDGTLNVGITESNPNGALYFDGNDLYISGKITTSSGKIGPWEVCDSAIYKGSGVLGTNDSNDSDIYIGDLGISFGNKLVYSSTTGNLEIKGKITTSSGKIGPWNVTSSAIYKGNGTLGKTGAGNIYLGDSGISFSNKLVYSTSDESLKIGPWSVNDSAIYRSSSDIGNADGTYLGTSGISFGDKLVYKDKLLSISGKVTADSGKIGPWNIISSAIYKGNSDLGTAGNSNIYLGDNGISISDKLVYKTLDGSLSVKGDINAETIKIKDKIVLYNYLGNELNALQYSSNDDNTIGVTLSGDFVTVDTVTTKITGNLYVQNTKDNSLISIGIAGGGTLKLSGNMYLLYSSSRIYAKNSTTDKNMPLIGLGGTSNCFTDAESTIHVGSSVEINGANLAIKGNVTAGFIDTTAGKDDMVTRYLRAKNYYRSISLYVSGSDQNYAGLYDADYGWVLYCDTGNNVRIPKVLYSKSIHMESGSLYVDIGSINMTKGSLHIDSGSAYFSKGSIYIASGYALRLSGTDDDVQNGIIGVFTTDNYTDLTRVGNPSHDTSINAKGNVWKNGSTTTYFQTTTSSDIRLKNIISDMSKYEQFYTSLSPIAYKYHDGLYEKTPHIHWGFSAQNAVEAFKKNNINWKDQEFVVVEDGELTSEEKKYVKKDLLKMNYQNMIALNTHMTQKNIKEIEDLKRQLQIALNRIRALEAQR